MSGQQFPTSESQDEPGGRPAGDKGVSNDESVTEQMATVDGSTEQTHPAGEQPQADPAAPAQSSSRWYQGRGALVAGAVAIAVVFGLGGLGVGLTVADDGGPSGPGTSQERRGGPGGDGPFGDLRGGDMRGDDMRGDDMRGGGPGQMLPDGTAPEQGDGAQNGDEQDRPGRGDTESGQTGDEQPA